MAPGQLLKEDIKIRPRMAPMKLYVRVILLTIVIFLMVQNASGFKMTLLHTSELHSRFEQTDRYGGVCTASRLAAGQCYGGIARIKTMVDAMKKKFPNTLLVDSGNMFQGTLWFSVFKWTPVAQFANYMGYGAMAIGDSEFATGIAGLIPFLENATFPVLSCNIDASAEPSINGKFSRSTIKTVGGEKIGIIGVSPEDTPFRSPSGKLKFNKAVSSVQMEVKKLTTQGINKIIVIGLNQPDVDREIAENVAGIDLLVSGHSDAFTYSGDHQCHKEIGLCQFDNMNCIGAYKSGLCDGADNRRCCIPPKNGNIPDVFYTGQYPHVITSKYGKKVPVLKYYAFGKYLGFQELEFDGAGNLTKWNGQPILLDKSVTQDPVVLKEMQPWIKKLEAARYVVHGKTDVFLDGERRNCRLGECNLGNFLADALVDFHGKHPNGIYWTEAPIGLVNSGAIRSSIMKGDITMGDILKVAPFRNEIDMIKIDGSLLMEILEHSVAAWDPVQMHGKFLQVSGVNVTYDITRPIHKRVVSVYVRCGECKQPSFSPLDLKANYTVMMSAYLIDGGDGYNMIKPKLLSRLEAGDLDYDVYLKHIKKMSPIRIGLQSRIRVTSVVSSTGQPAVAMMLLGLMVMLSALII